MKKLIVGTFATVLFVSVTFAQRTVKQPMATKPKTTAPAPTAAMGFYNAGLKCPAADYDCQVSNYTKAINLKLETPAVFKNRGNAFLAQQEYAAAIKDLNRAKTLDPNDAAILKSIAAVFMKIGEPDLALQNLTAAAQLEPKDVEIYKQRIAIYSLTGASDKAINDLTKLIGLAPTDVTLYESRAEKYIDQRVFDNVIADYTKLISLKPDNIDYYYRRAGFYLATRNVDAALQDYSKAIELRPNDASGYITRAGLYSRQKTYDKALADYDKAILLQPNIAHAYVARGKLQLGLKETDKALIDLSKAIALDATNWPAYSARGNIYLAQKKYDLALKDLTAVISADPTDVDALVGRGTIYQTEKKNDLALDDFTKALSLNPDNETATKARISLYLSKYGFASSKYTTERDRNRKLEVERASKIIANDPANSEAYIRRGVAYYTDNYQTPLNELAVKDLLKAVELDPTSSGAWKELARAYSTLDSKHAEDEISALKKSLELDPKQIDTYIRLTYACALHGKAADALIAANKAIEIDPTAAAGFSLRGYYYESIGKDLDKALQDYQKARELSDEQDKIQYTGSIAGILRKQNKTPQAIALLDDLVKQDPESAQAYRTRARFYYSGEAPSPSDRAKAIADFNKVLQLTPDNLDIYFDLYGASGANDVSALSRAIEIDPRSVFFYSWRALYYASKFDYQRAIRDYEKAVELEPDNQSYREALESERKALAGK